MMKCNTILFTKGLQAYITQIHSYVQTSDYVIRINNLRDSLNR